MLETYVVDGINRINITEPVTIVPNIMLNEAFFIVFLLGVITALIIDVLYKKYESRIKP